MTQSKKRVYDLEKRTTKFAIQVITFANKIPRNPVTTPLITQLVKSGTSIGSNYCEADCAETKKDFEHKIGICKKEAKETVYWLTVISQTLPNLSLEAKKHQDEATELKLIFITIVNNSRNKK